MLTTIHLRAFTDEFQKIARAKWRSFAHVAKETGEVFTKPGYGRLGEIVRGRRGGAMTIPGGRSVRRSGSSARRSPGNISELASPQAKEYFSRFPGSKERQLSQMRREAATNPTHVYTD